MAKPIPADVIADPEDTRLPINQSQAATDTGDTAKAEEEHWPGELVSESTTSGGGGESYPGEVTGDKELSDLRTSYAKELEDPQVTFAVYNLTQNEVGSHHPERTRSFIETLFNRAASRGLSLAQVVSDPHYYPGISFRRAHMSDDDLARFDDAVTDVVSGSNHSNYATGNAS